MFRYIYLFIIRNSLFFNINHNPQILQKILFQVIFFVFVIHELFYPLFPVHVILLFFHKKLYLNLDNHLVPYPYPVYIY